ncbi:tRNA synthetase class II (A) [Kribbella orskensis]|uniref:alanine--tRNA ligase n=1 Tax=Kribbella orskensis TaxID=2512216 RepID=A0ABY2BS65_9ACTN|nr:MULTISPECIES: alanine--tRNA ligase-related protein [Kribbella]TCN42901.1 tRNA synthetase class II (A) [Kribbella sp. VKM Ac-2500]TCO29743.1 tRNA synthetase class II (A) [Kribbella orskensis]
MSLDKTFIDFFVQRGHIPTTGSSLIPRPGDPVLFTTSGMHPLTPYLEGEPHPLGRRLVGVQRCLRTTDLDEVGDPTHLTVFEMLGSWSLGDYGSEQTLRWGFELLRDGFGIDPGRMYVTVFGGDDQVELDQESLRTWQSLGVPVELTTDDNWWSNGPTGPCGPDSEIFLWTGDGSPEGTPTTDDRWVEVWNHVMMRYRRYDDGSLEPLQQRNIDTGLGLERLSMLLEGKKSVYETELFEPWMRIIPELWKLDEESERIVIDHLRSSMVIIGDGVHPSNTGRGYVLRRLIRRVLTLLWRTDDSRTLSDLPLELFEHTLHHFHQGEVVTLVRRMLIDEEIRFTNLLERGRRILSHERFQKTLDQNDFEYLHETHGLPRELVLSLVG